jgi:hypothetical protein
MGQAGLADSQKVVVNSPRASGEVGTICVGIQQSSPRYIRWLGPVVVESDKRALDMKAEGTKGLLCGDNSSGRQWKYRARVHATLANCWYVG